MKPIRYVDRITGRIEEEAVYGEWALRLVYHPVGSFLGLKYLVGRSPCFSKTYGWLQRLPFSKRKIAPFVQKYRIDTTEFARPVAAYRSFDDFFTRHLKPEARPFAEGKDVAILPADGRYLVSPNLSKNPNFFVKEQAFDLHQFLRNEELAARYAGGALVLARLCPTDYHRFHFPCEGTPRESSLIQGTLFSVNPFALAQRLSILWENRRHVCEMETAAFGRVLLVEIGATNVGAVHQTYDPRVPQKKGNEKGYFSFGGSSIVLLFERDAIVFDEDLVDASQQGLETRGLMGQRLGVSKKIPGDTIS